MKKILAFACYLFLFMGCSIPKDDLSVSEDPFFPVESEVFGRSVAKEIRGIATNLNEKGIDYSLAKTSPLVRQQLFQELYKDIPAVATAEPATSNEDYSLVPIVSQENMSQITDRQVALLAHIVHEYRISRSDEAFLGKLENINKKTYALPEMERERLFNFSAALYYGLKEVQLLRKEGLMPPAGNPVASIPRLKSFSENGTAKMRTTEASADRWSPPRPSPWEGMFFGKA